MGSWGCDGLAEALLASECGRVGVHMRTVLERRKSEALGIAVGIAVKQLFEAWIGVLDLKKWMNSDCGFGL